MVEWTVYARNDLKRESSELIVLSSSHSKQLFFRHAIRPHYICGALCTDNGGTSFKSNVGNIQNVVEMSVSHENKICPLNVCDD